MYVKLENDTVVEIIPDEDPSFPGVPIEKRYDQNFISKLIHIDNEVDVRLGSTFIAGQFINPPVIDPDTGEVDDSNHVVFPDESAYDIKIKELSDECTRTIYNGTDVMLSDGTVEHFTLNNEDQLNLSGIALKIVMGDTDISWHFDDETVPCKHYSVEDAKIIIGTLTAFKEYHITYFRDLRIFVRAMEDIDLVKIMRYGFLLPESAKSEVLKGLEVKMGMRPSEQEIVETESSNE